MPPARLQPVIAILALVGLFAISVLIGYVGGLAFLAPSSPSPKPLRSVPSPAGEVNRPPSNSAPAQEISKKPAASEPSKPTAESKPPAVSPTPSTPAPSTESGNVYRVQVGAYISQLNAESRVAKLREQGFDAYMTHAGGLYRVQVGAFTVRQNAERMADRLRAAGYEVMISP